MQTNIYLHIMFYLLKNLFYYFSYFYFLFSILCLSASFFIFFQYFVYLFKIIKLFMNTIDNPEIISPQTIYNYDHGLNITWNIPQYKIPREYLDPVLQTKQRQWASQKKGDKDRKYVTKRGFYMDYDIKIASSIPGSDKHGKNSPWAFDKLLAMSKHRKVDKNLIKRSYLDEIQIEQKNRKKPGICTYSLEKSLKEKDAIAQEMKKRKYFVGEKHFYHEDTSFLGDKVPGSGTYNPHDEINKIRQNKTTYKDWVKKHSETNQKLTKREGLLPAPGTYSPLNATFTSFELIERQQKKNSKSKSKQKNWGFGTDARFEYTREDKKKIKEQRPDPISYNTAYGWREKKGSPKNRPWNESIHKGYQTLSVYH